MNRDLLPLLVGESNPYGPDQRFALYPDPPGCAGHRLCHRVLGVPRVAYLACFRRTNLLVGPGWSAERAVQAARAILDREVGGSVVVLLGKRAVDVDRAPGDRGRRVVLVALPHPSGRCRAWNEPGAVDRARELLRRAGAYRAVEERAAALTDFLEVPR